MVVETEKNLMSLTLKETSAKQYVLYILLPKHTQTHEQIGKNKGYLSQSC